MTFASMQALVISSQSFSVTAMGFSNSKWYPARGEVIIGTL